MKNPITANLMAFSLAAVPSGIALAATEAQAGIGALALALLFAAIFGAVVGWIASLLVKGTGLGLIGDILLGAAGAVVGGWIFRMAGIQVGEGILASLVPAVAGAVLVLLVAKMLKK
jgi:uncharacterized membrane protein YeaQ/YmgE (transglycosylase-associated protein family)